MTTDKEGKEYRVKLVKGKNLLDNFMGFVLEELAKEAKVGSCKKSRTQSQISTLLTKVESQCS